MNINQAAIIAGRQIGKQNLNKVYIEYLMEKMMDITMCINKECPFNNKCFRYIEHYPVTDKTQAIAAFSPYNPDTIELSNGTPKIFNPDVGEWEPEPMCFGPLKK